MRAFSQLYCSITLLDLTAAKGIPRGRLAGNHIRHGRHYHNYTDGRRRRHAARRRHFGRQELLGRRQGPRRRERPRGWRCRHRRDGEGRRHPGGEGFVSQIRFPIIAGVGRHGTFYATATTPCTHKKTKTKLTSMRFISTSSTLSTREIWEMHRLMECQMVSQPLLDDQPHPDYLHVLICCAQQIWGSRPASTT